MKRARNYQQGLPYTGIYPIPNCDEDRFKASYFEPREGLDSKMTRKILWLAVFLLNLALQLVLAEDCTIIKPRKKKSGLDIWETTVKCKDVRIYHQHELDHNNKTEKQLIEFFCDKHLRNRCENHDARCKLPANLNGIARLFNESDFNNITELEFRNFQLELPGDVFKIFPKVVTLYLRHTDPIYER